MGTAALPSPAAAALLASLYASAVLRGRRRQPVGRITNHTEGKKRKTPCPQRKASVVEFCVAYDLLAAMILFPA
jgi:hypothetical protein